MDPSEAPLYHTVIACGIIIVLIMSVFVFSSIWMQRRLKAKRRSKAEAAIMRVENERTRIAADLHDAAGPLIYSIKRKLEDSVAADHQTQHLLNESQQLLKELSGQLNSLSRSMVPLSLVQFGLLYCLRELVAEKSLEHKLDIIFRCPGLPAMDKKAETHIFRMIQEIIQNTVKHAGAGRLVIELERTRKGLLLRTSDDGRGLDVTKIKRLQPGQGIGNIETRASFFNGTASMLFMVANGKCAWN